jgi:poly-D-alanine transfer protein DltD
MSDIDFKKLSKKELEDLGIKYGIDLDRRLLKSKMVKQLKNFIDSLSKDDLEQEARKEGVELDKRLTKDKLVSQVAEIGEEEVINTSIPSLDEKRAKLRNLNF